jgi:hypothetical protein
MRSTTTATTATIAIAAAVGLLLPAAVQAKEIHLWGKQKPGNIARGPKRTGNSVTLKGLTPIVRVERSADRFTLWRNGQPYATMTKDVKLAGALPAGRYSVRPSSGAVHLYLDPQAKPQPVTLWAKQKAGPGHRIERNVVVLGVAHKVVDFHYKGTKGVGVFKLQRAKTTRRPQLRYISPHDPHGKGPRVIGPKGRKLGKQMKGQTLPPGAYLLTPGLGKTDRIVQAEMKPVVK